ncbi:hypothetical protein J1N35_041833 [Gossypium stocksii]|uniref:Uncharacterized protein n=1 Tax=Gossypium stocksii TaxID=47602 RepID=A0A9D3ZJ04_9ROSI|nr:hypothetical protein J1N35_041833 [Gossypium stocksii]
MHLQMAILSHILSENVIIKLYIEFTNANGSDPSSTTVATNTADTFNLPSYSKTNTVMNAKGLSSKEQLLRCNKGDAPFGATTVVVIKQPIYNNSRCRVDPSLTFTVLEYPLST